MKKTLSLLLALVMLLTSVSAVVSVQATEKTPQVTAVETQIEKAAQYIINNTYDMSSLSYQDYYLLLRSGVDMSAYKADWMTRLKDNLDKNNGKIIIEGANWYQDEYDQWYSVPYSYEDIAVYGAVIQTLCFYGYAYDIHDFEGYDVTAPLRDFDLSQVANPYSFRLAMEGALNEFNGGINPESLAIDLISNYYDMGKGMNYYGYSCDNTAHFVASLAAYASGDYGQSGTAYAPYVEDALKVIKTYTKEDGAFCDDTYVPNVNADSTALAMMAFACAKDYDNAYWYYEKLTGNFYNAETGAFQVYGADDLYATKDALLALEYYYQNINNAHTWDEGVVQQKSTCTRSGRMVYTCQACGKTETRLISPSHTPGVEVKENEVPCTCTVDGTYDAVVYCAVCQKELSRTPCKVKAHHIGEITEIKGIRQDPTYDDPGYQEMYDYCTACNQYVGTHGYEIPKLGPKVSLSTCKAVSVDDVQVNGFVNQNSLVVKDGDYTLRRGIDFKLNNNTVSTAKVGNGKALIYGIGKYCDTMTVTFKIVPKATKLTKVTAARKGFTAKWNKQTAQTTGYQLQYSTKKSFKNAKTVTVTSNKTVSKKIGKLKAKKTYYVRVRTYKTVKGKKYCSSWSTAKSVKTK